jgi:hypothetical protein
VLVCMKRQIIECRRRTNKKFGFDTMLCSFLFKWVAIISPRETVRGHVAFFPAVIRWEVLQPRQGGGRTIEGFDDKFFDW